MLYIVTGVGGFIGWKVAAQLLESGHLVIGLDNMNDAYDVRLKRWHLDQIRPHSNLDFHEVSILDRAALDRIVRRANETPAAVINLAARAGVRQSVVDPWVYYQTNVTGTLNLLELCKQHGINKFILSSTSSLYGKSAVPPFSEDDGTDLPLSPYTASKKAAEVLCHTYHHLYGLDITVFRYFTVYGPGGRPDMSPLRFVQWIYEGREVNIYGDGSQSRDFTYIDDIAQGTITGLKPVGFEMINLGGEKTIGLMEMIRLMEQQIGREAKIVYHPKQVTDMQLTHANIEKARSLLGWEPVTDFRSGIAKLVDWYAENRDWAKGIITW